MNISESIEILKAIADSSRLRIINSLIEKPHYVEELAARLNLAVSTVSFHLKKMEKAGLLKKRKEQYYVVYQLNEELFNLSLKEFVSFQNIEKYAQEERISNYRNKVLNTYFKDGKLQKIPSQHKKRWIILEEISAKFNEDKIYSEQEVNDIISEAFNDYCTIRRYFIDEKMMERKDGKYWLIKKEVVEPTGLRKSYLDSISDTKVMVDGMH